MSNESRLHVKLFLKAESKYLFPQGDHSCAIQAHGHTDVSSSSSARLDCKIYQPVKISKGQNGVHTADGYSLPSRSKKALWRSKWKAGILFI